MKKLISITVSGFGTVRQFAGENVENDFIEAVKKAAGMLTKENLHYATVELMEDGKVVKEFELMRK